MRVLVVYCHPVPESFCAALRDAVMEALRAGRREVRQIDLHAEDFDPVMRAEERRHYDDGAPGDPVLLRHAEAIRWAQGMIFVYPTWWYGLPAMLKGWIDRVWARDVAFAVSAEGAFVPMMRHVEKLGVVTTCGASRWVSFLTGQPGRKTLLRGLRALCAPRCRTMFLAQYEIDASTAEKRAAFLALVRERVRRF